jgi:chromosome partitioning protein
MSNDWSGVPTPSVVVGELSRKPFPTPHIIVFANEKGGVGKTTLALHSCAALCHSGAAVLAIDLDNRQRTLAGSLEMREATARILKVGLPTPKFAALDKQSGGLLVQEIQRLGAGVNFVVIDLPGADTATARYALAMADTIVTPVGASVYDLNVLARFNPATREFSAAGHFAALIAELKNEKAQAGLRSPDWIVMRNRSRGSEGRLGAIVGASLDEVASAIGCRIGTGLPESISFRDLNGYGLTYLDLGLIPSIGKRNYKIEKTVGDVIRQYNLPGFEYQIPKNNGAERTTQNKRDKTTVPVKTSRAYYEALSSHRSLKI